MIKYKLASKNNLLEKSEYYVYLFKIYLTLSGNKEKWSNTAPNCVFVS